MSKLTVTQVKKKLEEYSQEELIELVCKAYKTFPEMADLEWVPRNDSYYDDLLEKDKGKIWRAFFNGRTYSLRDAKAVITAFKNHLVQNESE